MITKLKSNKRQYKLKYRRLRNEYNTVANNPELALELHLKRLNKKMNYILSYYPEFKDIKN